jgi:hypothetical protein
MADGFEGDEAGPVFGKGLLKKPFNVDCFVLSGMSVRDGTLCRRNMFVIVGRIQVCGKYGSM